MLRLVVEIVAMHSASCGSPSPLESVTRKSRLCMRPACFVAIDSVVDIDLAWLASWQMKLHRLHRTEKQMDDLWSAGSPGSGMCVCVCSSFQNRPGVVSLFSMLRPYLLMFVRAHLCYFLHRHR